jgi:hypothetical protein
MTVPVRTAEDMRACEERLRQLVEKLKSEGINMTQWRLGTFQRMLCPEVVWPPVIPSIVVVSIYFLVIPSIVVVSIYFLFSCVYSWMSTR